MTLIKIGDREIDFAKAFPLQIGDWMRLDALGLLRGKLDFSSPRTIMELLHLLAAKVDPATTRNEISSIPLHELPQVIKCISDLMARDLRQPQEVTRHPIGPLARHRRAAFPLR